MAMHHFYLRSPSSVGHLDEDFRRMLGDTDPGVMEGALVLFYQLVKVGGAGVGRGRSALWKGWRLATEVQRVCCFLVQCLYKDTMEMHVTSAPPPPLPSRCPSPSLYLSPSLPLPSPPAVLPPPSSSPSSPSSSGPASQVQVDGAHIRQPPPVSHWPPAAEGDGVPWSPCPLGSDQVTEDTGHLGSR